MKRKMIAGILTASLVGAMSFPAWAVESTFNQDTATTGSGMNLKYEVKETYTITIPEHVTFAKGDHSKTGKVKASEVLIGDGKELKVTMGSNYFDSENMVFRMKDTVSTKENYLKYSIKRGEISSQIEIKTNNAEVLNVKAGVSSGEETLTFESADPSKAGTYTDTLTFTSSVVAETTVDGVL